MTTTYFRDVYSLDDLKREYRRAAMQHHPDRGGDAETMKAVNAEYERVFGALKRQQNTQAAEDATGKARATTETAADFIQIIDQLLKLDGLEIELCGRWLWIGGETRKHKEALKAAGCRWSSTKKLWSWHFAEDGARWHRGRYSMEQIRGKYGSTTFTRGAAAGSDALPA